MAKIAKNTNKLNPVQLQGKLDVSLTAVAAEPTTFTGAAALLTTGEERSDELEAANQKVANLTAQLAQAREERELKCKKALEFYDDFVHYVKGIAKGRAEIILLAAMDVAGVPGPAQPMTKVQNNRLKATDTEQSLLGYWESKAGARYYDVQVSANPNDPESWEDYDTTSTASVVLEGLPSGQKRWTRVRAGNRLGKGPWSDPACAMVP